ncbi:MAG: hypothetical protein ACXAEN_13825 [Candidatus Thorarchaeota archaeon]
MKRINILMTMILLSLFAVGLTTLPAGAHGSQDNDMSGMPGMPDMGHMPGYEMGEEAIWIDTDVITVMAMEEMPAFNFWYSSDDNGSIARFMAAYMTIAEFEDTNGDDAFQFNETLYSAPLGAYEWTLQTGDVQDENGVTTEVWLKYTKSGTHVGGPDDDHEMPGMDMMFPMYHDDRYIEKFEDVTIQLWAHIYLDDFNGNVSDSEGVRANYTVAGGSELKVDIEIGNFPFTSNTSKVALQTMLRENMAMGSMMMDNHMFMIREMFRNVTGNSMMDWTTDYGNETRFERVMDTHMQQIDFVDTSTGITQGFYKWVDQAVISWLGGDTEAVNVTASYTTTGMGLSLFLAYPNFGNGSILHDPSIGLVEGAGPLSLFPLSMPITIAIIGLAVFALVVVVIRKR